MYPGIVRIGGNTGTTDSFVGIDTGDLTKGVYDGTTLFEGNNLACFFMQASMAGLVDSIDPLLQPVGTLLSFMKKNLGPLMSKLSCPQLDSFDNSLFDPKKFPGATYKGETD